MSSQGTATLDEALKSAELACQQCNYENALNLYSLVINKDPNNWNHYVERSMVNIYLRRYEQALHDSQISVKINPKNFKGHYQCGIALRQLARYYAASVAFSKAVALNPENKLYLTGLIDAALKSPLKESLSIVMEQLEEMKLEKNPFVVLSVIGQDLLAHEQAASAVEVLECALVIGTRSPKLKGSVFSALGSAFWSLDKHERAIFYMKEDLKVSELYQDKASQCRAHGNLGAAYFILQSYNLALDAHRRQLDFASQINNSKSIVAALSGLGSASTSLGRHQDALHYHEKAAEEASTDTLLKCREFGKAGAAARSLSDVDQSLRLHQKRLEALHKEGGGKSSQEKSEEADALNDLAAVYKDLRRSVDELNCLRKASQISQSINDSANEAKTLVTLGFATRHAGNLTEAISCYERLLEISVETRDKTLEGRSYSHLGIVYHQAGDFEKALTAQNKYLSLATENKDVAAQGRAHANIGIAYSAMGLYEQAVKHHQKELEISRKLGDSESQCSTHGNLAIAFQALRKNDLAVQHYCDQLELSQQIESVENESRALMNLGNFYNTLGRYEEAITAYRQYLTLLKTSPNLSGEGRALYNLGFACYQLKRYLDAVECYQKSVTVATNGNDRIALARASCNLGLAHKQLGQYEAALDCQRRFLAISKDLNSTRGTFKALGNLGDLHSSQKRTDLSVEAYEKQLELARNVNDPTLTAQALSSLGTTLRSSGQYDRALSIHREEADIYRKSLKDTKNEYRAQGRLGATLTALGKVEEARECYERQVELTTNDNSSKTRALRAWSNLAIAHTNLHEYDQAAECLRRQVELLPSAGGSDYTRTERCTALCRLGDCLFATEKFSEAADAYLKAHDVATTLKKRQLVDRSLEGVVGSLNMNNQLDEAIVFARKRVEGAEKAEDSFVHAAACGDLGVLLAEVGEHEQSVKWLSEQMRLGLEVGDEQIKSDAACALGNAYLLVHDYSRAVDFHKLDLEIAVRCCNRPCQGRAQCNLAIVYERAKDYAAAVSSQEQHLFIAEEENDDMAKLNALQGIARNLLMVSDADYSKTISLLQQALFHAKEVKDVQANLDVLVQLARGLWSCGQPAEALDQLKEAVRIIEENPNEVDTGDIPEIMLFYMSCLFENGHFQEALMAAENSRSPNTSLTFEKVLEFVNNQNKTLIYYSVVCKRFVYIWVILPYEGLGYCGCHVIGRDTTIADQVSLLRTTIGVDTGEEADASVATKSRPEPLHYCNLLVNGRGGLPSTSTRSIETGKSPVHTLDDILLGAEVSGRLRQVSDNKQQEQDDKPGLAIICDHVLFFCPFSLLKRRSNEHFLSRRFNLQQVRSLTDLMTWRQYDHDFEPRINCCAVFGNPCLPTELSRHFPPSIASEEETSLIASLAHTEGRTGKCASKRDAVQQLTCSEYVHFACPLSVTSSSRGVMLCNGNHEPMEVPPTPCAELTTPTPDDDAKSCVTVVLKPPSKEEISEYLLTCKEIQSLDMSNCKLVTLGSPHLLPPRCDVDFLRESLHTLVLSFLNAGAAACMLSMWPVPETAYRLFMQNFLQYLNKGSTIFVAFNQARDALSESSSFAHPSYWAGFILYGREVSLNICVSAVMAHSLAAIVNEPTGHDTIQLISHFLNKALEQTSPSSNEPPIPIYTLQETVIEALGEESVAWRKIFSVAGFELRPENDRNPAAIFFPKDEMKSQLQAIHNAVKTFMHLPAKQLTIIGHVINSSLSCRYLAWLQSSLLPWMEDAVHPMVDRSNPPLLPDELCENNAMIELLHFMNINTSKRDDDGKVFLTIPDPSTSLSSIRRCLHALRLILEVNSAEFERPKSTFTNYNASTRQSKQSTSSVNVGETKQASFRSRFDSASRPLTSTSGIAGILPQHSIKYPVLPSMFRLNATAIQNDTSSMSSSHRADESLLSDIDTQRDDCGILTLEEPKIFTQVPSGSKIVMPKAVLPSKATAFSPVKQRQPSAFTTTKSFQLAGSLGSLLHSGSPSLLASAHNSRGAPIFPESSGPESGIYGGSKPFAPSYFSSSLHHQQLPKICVVSPQREQRVPETSADSSPLQKSSKSLQTMFGVVRSASADGSKPLEIHKLQISNFQRRSRDVNSLASSSSASSSKSEPPPANKQRQQQRQKTAEILRRLSSRNKHGKLDIDADEKVEFV